MRQTADFTLESEILNAALDGLTDSDFQRATQFKGWTINDVLVHLHFWNKAADNGVFDPAALHAVLADVREGLKTGGLRVVENRFIPERGPDLRAIWRDTYQNMGDRWAEVDPKMRVDWAGPSMSARSSITARQMETWAHGHEVFDLLGKTRVETDRIKNIVVLGVNTFGWSHQVNGFEVPEKSPRLTLTAPSGAIWEFGHDDANTITGSAVGFAQIVTQTRAFADTDIVATGPIATRWMQSAQCFAGPRENPPQLGSRFVT